MTDLSIFKITDRWPPKNPNHIQLYSLPTPNGVKASIMLQETGLPYDAHLVNFGTDDQMTPEFLSLNPNNKIPAIIDPNGPNGEPLPLWESGAILIYLAEKTDKFLSKDPVIRYNTLQWLMFQMGGLGPMLGQLGFFHKFAGKEYDDKRPRDRYAAESARILKVIDAHLEGKEWMVGDYSIADIAIAPWLRQVPGFYEAVDLVGWTELKNVQSYLNRFLARPAVQAGLNSPERPS